MKKKTFCLRIISAVLALSLSFSAFSSFAVFAEEPKQKQLTDSSGLWHPKEEAIQLNTEGDLPLEELETAELAEEDIPEIVTQEAIEANGHVNRLWEQEEDLNSIIFQNRDGKKTMYYFAEPVKYKDKDGNIKDKKNKLSETAEGGFTNVENDINSYFPKKLHKNKGVVLRHQDISIEVAPLINGSSGASRQTGHNKDSQPTDYVEYPAVFDDSISLRYTPTFNGFKEDIILSENAGINKFQFKVKTGGLSLVEEDGIYYLSNPLTGEKVVQIGNLVVYDSRPMEVPDEILNESVSNPTEEDRVKKAETLEELIKSVPLKEAAEKPQEEDIPPIYNHHYAVDTVVQDEEYLITITVDESYLSDPERIWPVYVDPTISVSGSGTSSGRWFLKNLLRS